MIHLFLRQSSFSCTLLKAKMNIVSSSCSKPVWVSFFCWTQNKRFRRMLGNKVAGSHSLTLYFFPYYGSQWLPAKTFWRMWISKPFLVPIDIDGTHWPYYFITIISMEVNVCLQLFGKYLGKYVFLKKLFRRMWVSKQLLNFHCILFPYNGSQWLPSAVWKLFGKMCFFLKNIFRRMWVSKQLLNFHCILFPYYGSQWLPSAVWKIFGKMFFF